jgi:hypothetical protein
VLTNEALLRSLLGGWIVGAALALVATAVLLVALTRSQAKGRNWLPGWERVKPPIVGILFVNLLGITCTACGLVLGALYYRARVHAPSPTLLTPNLVFSSVVSVGVCGLVAAAAFVRRRAGATTWLLGALTMLAFGWVLPNIAR